MTVTVLLADDHQIVRQGLAAILSAEADFHVVGEAADGLEALRRVERLTPDVLVLDLMMPGLGGIDVARQVSSRSPRTHVVVLSMHSDQAYVREALRAGAGAFVMKEAGVEELVRAIREVMAGRQYVSLPLFREFPDVPAGNPVGPPQDPFDTLTAREREVLQLTAEGYTGAEISRKLFISPRTVESHRVNLMRKMRIRNQKELVRYAIERRLLPDRRAEKPAREGAGGEVRRHDNRSEGK